MTLLPNKHFLNLLSAWYDRSTAQNLPLWAYKKQAKHVGHRSRVTTWQVIVLKVLQICSRAFIRFFFSSLRVWLKLVVEVKGFSCSVTAEVNCFLHGIRLNRFYSPWLIKGGLKRFCHSLWTQWCRNRNNLYFLSVGKCSCTRSKVTGMSKHADSTESKNIK